jgi:hypothetical protein
MIWFMASGGEKRVTGKRITPEPGQSGVSGIIAPPLQHDETVELDYVHTTSISPLNGHPATQGVYGTGEVLGGEHVAEEGEEEEEEEERSGLKLGLGDFVFVRV